MKELDFANRECLVQAIGSDRYLISSPEYIGQWLMRYKVQLPNAPDVLVQSVQDSANFFDAAYTNWLTIYPDLSSKLLSLNNTSVDIREYHKPLKDYRRKGQQLASAFLFFSSAHDIPQNLSQFLKHLGKFIDSPHRVNKLQKAQKLLEGGLQDFDFAPSDKGGFFDVFSSVQGDLRTYLQKDELSLEEYHDRIRKNARHMLNAFKVARYARPLNIDLHTQTEYLVGANMLVTAAQGFFKDLILSRGVDECKVYAIISDSTKAQLFEVFDYFVPSVQLLGHRRVLVNA